MEIDYRWKTAGGVTGTWYAVAGSDDIDGYDETARQALTLTGVRRVSFDMGHGDRLQFRRAKKNAK